MKKDASKPTKRTSEQNDYRRKIDYPGQVKITVIRETRAVSYAK